jgi:hypothetical protein
MGTARTYPERANICPSSMRIIAYNEMGLRGEEIKANPFVETVSSPYTTSLQLQMVNK